MLVYTNSMKAKSINPTSTLYIQISGDQEWDVRVVMISAIEHASCTDYCRPLACGTFTTNVRKSLNSEMSRAFEWLSETAMFSDERGSLYCSAATDGSAALITVEAPLLEGYLPILGALLTELTKAVNARQLSGVNVYYS